ncbi:AraC family transcriptional regulator [Rhizobium sp. VS19-DR104.2]|uniref:helix-turn-helix domain-containing protein n=1 Tax=unclassified Rhizobium TaxID=2613769 RepID=UPI001C5BF517|nr:MULTISPECIES: AraC family transcriptional regulator [unclassified Rhizobium]MBZ5763754.1 AraC family transcriptional regulator [Rhizobium sp. VS19-DR96]MBZ5769689.1 AraC family transcriptional regulator [Rhizobium sp. VS19-DR129.2]MBZ5777242.1 AraC family transcriptional regulator [Rhizobium sp. VS19-DRK62.2]MBZ5788360.1 AraC family transcriptional regulator [Rhizobium sp. VS19-DR121]MBZ5805807.1 AraC family transcriptional regulator [Rhizobium sp. VS19-DR181]
MTASDLHPTFKHGPCRTVSHQTKSWSQMHAALVRRTGLEREETQIMADRHLVLLNLQGQSERGEHFLDNRRTGFVRRRAGAILFIPAGSNWRGWETGASNAAYLSLTVDPAKLDDLFAPVKLNTRSSLSPDLGFEDQIVMNAMRGIGAELQGKSPLSDILVQSYVTTIFTQLLRRQNSLPSRRQGGLSPAIRTRIMEKIEDELDDHLSLQQLADLAGLSIPHLCRAFKQSFGKPPYSYIIQCRVERAKHSLRDSTLSVTEIALSCGFSSASHFANVFRKEVGTTPLDYRAAWSGRAFS